MSSYLAGEPLELVCYIELHPAVDSAVTVFAMWLRNSVQLNNSTRIAISDPIATDLHHHESNIQFVSLSTTVDSGNYSCTVTIIGTTSSYIGSASGTTEYMISVRGLF